MYSTPINFFSNTPTIKEVNLTETDSFSWLNVQEYKCHMDSIDQCSLRLCVYNIDLVEIIHGQYLNGFLLSQRRKMFNRRSFLLGNPSLIVICTRVKNVIQSLMFKGDGLINWVAL